MRLNGRGVYMLSIILYEIRQQKGYSLIRLVDSFMKMERSLIELCKRIMQNMAISQFQ